MIPTDPLRLTSQVLAEALNIHTPTQEQARVIAHRLSPLLVVTRVGSGKTAAMVQRVAYLVATEQVYPDQILGLAFTRKATAELDQRAASRLASLSAAGLLPATTPEHNNGAGGVADATDVDEPMIATYSSFAGTLMRDHGLRIGVDPDSTLITQARSWQIVISLLEARTLPLPNGSPSRNASAILILVGSLSRNLLTIEGVAKDLADLSEQFTALAAIKGCKTLIGKAPTVMAEREALLDVVAELHAYKRHHGLLDSGDQATLAYAITESVPEATGQVRVQYPVVLLDELQDTSVTQVQLLSALFADSRMIAVDDPHQVIYGWRGASTATLDTFHQCFNPTGTALLDSGTSPVGATPVLELSTSWRSDSTILDVVNFVSAPLRFGAVEDGDPVGKRLTVAPLRACPTTFGLEPGAAFGTFLQDPVEEAHTVVAFLAERWSPSAEMVVLCRAQAQMGSIATGLETAGLPYTIIGLGRMLYVPRVADVHALLTAASDPERGDRVVRFLTGFNIGARDLRALASLACELTRPTAEGGKEAPGTCGDHAETNSLLLSEALGTLLRRHEDEVQEEQEESAAVRDLTEAGRAVALHTARVTRCIRETVPLPLPGPVALVEQVLDPDIEVAARVGHTVGHRALDTFRGTARAFTADTDAPTLTGFLEWLGIAGEHKDVMSAPEVGPSPEAVQLLTVHAAKSLEWNVVVVPGIDEQVFPSYTSAIKDDLRVAETGWIGSTSTSPFPLRAGAGSPPPFIAGDLDPVVTDKPPLAETMSAYKEALGRQNLRKECRLAYAAFTRVRRELLLAGFRLSKTAFKPRRPSRSLTELQRRDLLSPYTEGWVDFDESRPNPLAALTQVDTWPPDVDATEPTDNQTPGAETEGTAVTGRLADARRTRYAAAAQVTAAMGGATPAQEMPAQAQPDDEMVRQWKLEAGLLLTECIRALSGGPVVRPPEHLAATHLDDLRADRHRFAFDLRRPLPPEPRATGRLGTVLHDAVAQRPSARGTLFGLGQAGVPDSLEPQNRDRIKRWLETARNLPLLKDCVLAETGTDREITVGATALRCRMDAVFQRLDGSGRLIIDWKTGRQRVPVNRLNIYVHAWATSQGMPTGAVRAACVYVDYPGRRVDELSAEGLLSTEQIQTALTVGQGLQ